MKDLRSLLRKDDPVAREGGLSPDDRDRMRRHILTATPEPVPASRRVFLVLATAVGVFIYVKRVVRHIESRAAATTSSPETAPPTLGAADVTGHIVHQAGWTATNSDL